MTFKCYLFIFSLIKAAVGNFCLLAKKLTLAVAWDLLGSNSAAGILFQLLSLFLLLSSVWTKIKQLKESKAE